MLGWVGDSERAIGICPSPVTTLADGDISWRVELHDVRVAAGAAADHVLLQVRTLEAGVAAGILDDRGGVARTVGDLGDRGFALLHQTVDTRGFISVGSGNARAWTASAPERVNVGVRRGTVVLNSVARHRRSCDRVEGIDRIASAIGAAGG